MIATIETEKLFTHHETLLRKVRGFESGGAAGKGKEWKSGKTESSAWYDYDMQKGEREFRLVPQAHVAMNYGIEDKPGEDFSMLVRQVSIDKL